MTQFLATIAVSATLIIADMLQK